MPSVHQGLVRHLYIPQHAGQVGPGTPPNAPRGWWNAPGPGNVGPGSSTSPGVAPGHLQAGTPILHRVKRWLGQRTGALTNPVAMRHPYAAATQTGYVPMTNPIGLRVKARQQVGQYSADGGDQPVGQSSSSSSAYQGQTNYQPSGGGGTTPASVVSSILGDLGGVLGGGGGSTATSAATSASSTSQANVPASYTPPTPTAPAPHPAAPTTTIVPAPAAAKSDLLWWIVGGVAAAGLILIAWRMFGHKGAKIAGMSAAKAAAYYRFR